MKLEDMRKKIEDDRKEREEKPFFERNFLNIKDYFKYRFLSDVESVPSRVKYFTQEHVRGYSDEDVWNLNAFFLRKIHGPLMAFVKHYEEEGMSLPLEFAEDPAAWLSILKDIEYAFDNEYKKEYEYESYHRHLKNLSEDAVKRHHEKISKGFELFGKYCMNLWD